MNSPTLRNALILSAASLLGSLALGCDKHEAQHDTDADAAAAKPKAAADDEPDLAQAVAAVAARPGAGDGVAAGAAGGPPPNGIFGPGEADKALAKGAPSTLTLGGDGSEPRVQLGPAPRPGSKRTGTLTIASQSDPQQGAIPISFALSIETQKGKADSDAGASAPLQVAAKVTGATINAPGVPPDLAGAIGKLKGSRVDYQVSADGAGSNFRYEAAKGIDPAFRDALQGLSDTLAVLALPFPSKPVGLGGFWMVTSRDVVMGLDVVTYRLVKVEKVEGTTVELSLNTKRYAASPAFNVEGLPPDAPHVMGEFRAGAEGKLTMSAGQAFPNSGDLQSLLGAALGPAPEPSQAAPGAPNKPQRPMVQVQSRVTIAFSGS
jgi:hypothetical protein